MLKIKPDISIVLPTWNRLTELKKTLPKLLSICNEKTEVIVVDNNSDDGTQNYLSDIAEVNILVAPSIAALNPLPQT